MARAVTFCLIVVGLINFAPVIGILSAQQLESTYAISLIGNDLEVLMRHRALLFGILGAFILYSAFKPVFQPAAMVMAFVSMSGFVVVALGIGGFNEALRKVMIIDIVGIVVLLIAMALKYKDKTT